MNMRVTQSMLSNNMLYNLNSSYSKLGKLDAQLSAGGKKFTKPSDNPVAAMLAMGYRSDLGRVEQYKENIGTVQNWLDSTDDALDQAGKALQKIRELTVEASNGPLEEKQRSYIAEEISQLKQQLIDIGDSQIGGKYLFGGTKTDQKPSDNNFATATGEINLEVFNGITMQANTPGKDIFASFTDGTPPNPLQQLITDLKDPNVSASAISDHLNNVDAEMDKLLTARAGIGAKQNRASMMEDRLKNQEVFANQILSDNEDEDVEKIIIGLTTQEAIHRAALNVGTRIIQPTLVDFLR